MIEDHLHVLKYLRANGCPWRKQSALANAMSKEMKAWIRSQPDGQDVDTSDDDMIESDTSSESYSESYSFSEDEDDTSESDSWDDLDTSTSDSESYSLSEDDTSRSNSDGGHSKYTHCIHIVVEKH